MATLNWMDALKDRKDDFSNWWETLLEVQREKKGHHIALTSNLLWQQWNARDRFHFQNEGTDAMRLYTKPVEE